MGRVRHPIYSNSGEVKCGYQLKKGINIARRCVNGYSITAAPVQSVTNMSFWWCVYQAQSNGGEYAMGPIAWAKGSVWFSIRGYKVPSEPSEPSGTPRCFRWKLGLLLMSLHSINTNIFLHWIMYLFTSASINNFNTFFIAILDMSQTRRILRTPNSSILNVTATWL